MIDKLKKAQTEAGELVGELVNVSLALYGNQVSYHISLPYTSKRAIDPRGYGETLEDALVDFKVNFDKDRKIQLDKARKTIEELGGK